MNIHVQHNRIKAYNKHYIILSISLQFSTVKLRLFCFCFCTNVSIKMFSITKRHNFNRFSLSLVCSLRCLAVTVCLLSLLHLTLVHLKIEEWRQITLHHTHTHTMKSSPKNVYRNRIANCVGGIVCVCFIHPIAVGAFLSLKILF